MNFDVTSVSLHNFRFGHASNPVRVALNRSLKVLHFDIEFIMQNIEDKFCKMALKINSKFIVVYILLWTSLLNAHSIFKNILDPYWTEIGYGRDERPMAY